MKNNKYISFEDFVNNSGVQASTIKRKYKKIPGIIKTDTGFKVLSGTRYPCDLHRYGLKNTSEKRYVLLKTISENKYISHTDLRVEQGQFEEFLRDFLAAGLIQRNNLCNEYGANAYDCTRKGDQILKKKSSGVKEELIKTIASAAGTFAGSIISRIIDTTA